jgi:hypothetical protein
MATFELKQEVNTFSEKYYTRREKVNPDIELCIVCGRKVGDNGFKVWVVNGGDTLATIDEEVNPAGDLGFWPIGSECIKPIPEAFRLQQTK